VARWLHVIMGAPPGAFSLASQGHIRSDSAPKHEQADDPGAVNCREPQGQIEDDAGKEACLAGAEQQTERVENDRRRNSGRCRYRGMKAKAAETIPHVNPRKICVLHLLHASRLIPADERARLVADAFTDELFSPAPQEFARIVFSAMRLSILIPV
jgi:hypothetical protein